MHPNRITVGKRQPTDSALWAFGSGGEHHGTIPRPKIKRLHVNIGELTAERDSLEHELGRFESLCLACADATPPEGRPWLLPATKRLPAAWV